MFVVCEMLIMQCYVILVDNNMVIKKLGIIGIGVCLFIGFIEFSVNCCVFGLLWVVDGMSYM